MLRPLAVLLGVSLTTTGAMASFAVALDLPQLVERSDRIVVGHVVAQQARWDGDRIVTDVLIEVDEALHGDVAAGDVLQVVRLGGAVGELGMRVEGEPDFVDGAAYVLFLRSWRGLFRPVGMSQGVLPIEEQGGARVVQPGGAGLALVTGPSARPAVGALTGPRPLRFLCDRIRALAAD